MSKTDPRIHTELRSDFIFTSQVHRQISPEALTGLRGGVERFDPIGPTGRGHRSDRVNCGCQRWAGLEDRGLLWSALVDPA